MAVATSEGANLTRYVPRLSAEWSLSTTEAWQEVEGTLCYIDISGFTALSEKLARRGRIGAEELTEVLNYVFGSMMAVAYDRGGSLVKFGGDALLLLFTGSNNETQAASAAVEMQTVLREARSYETSAGRLALKMSVGLHSGTLHLFRVGESHKELILTGPAASMTTEMEETAVAGEILISPAVKEAIGGEGADEAKGSGLLLKWRKARIECCGWIPRVPLSPEAFAEGLPVALRHHLQQGAAEPEHHIATVGFVKFQGVDALMEQGGPQAVAEALDELVRNVQHVVDEEGVTFLASDIDQDGGKIIIVSGVPGVQVDDEGRVLRAARQIVDNVGTLPVRIGVNQGHVFVGEVGTDIRATYTIMGDTVNLAARLMASASPGEIYASPSALDHSLTLFETTPLEPFYVKGKEHPVQAYAVGEAKGSRPNQRGGALPFVGRAEELTRIHTMIEELYAGKGNVVTVVGERGAGKSRLVDELLPALERAIHIDIRAEPYGIGTPYRPLRDPVRNLLGIKRGEHAEMAKTLHNLLANLLPERARLTPLLADVAMIDMPSTPEVDQIDPKFRQDRTADLLVEVIAAVCRNGPVVFEVDDGHYMDEASSHLMRRLVAASADHPWLFLTTRRDTEGGFDPKMEEMPLGPLSDEEARELVLEATAAAPLRPHEIEAIVQRGGGLPLFLEEIINAIRTAGDIESLPDSLDAVVSSQIDALPPLARRLLRFSSVLGRSFRISVLNELLETEGVRLDVATRRDLEGFLEPDGTDRLQFRHAMIRDVAYQGLSFKRRRELHLKAARVFEKMADDPESLADLLSLHYSIAGESERAWHYARRAGDQAREAYANVEAAAHYLRALESAKRLDEVSDDERAEVWSHLGDVREQAGLFDEALDAYRRAYRLRREAVARAELMLKRASARERAAQYSMALREATGAKRLLEDRTSAEAEILAARAQAFYSLIRMRQGRPAEALRTAREAVEQAQEADSNAALARAYGVMAWAHLMMDQPGAEQLWLEALDLYEKVGDLGGQGYMNNNLGGLAYFEGRWDEALEYYERSRDLAERLGNAVDVGVAEGNIGEVLVKQNKFDEAEPQLRRAVRVAQASGDVFTVVFANLQLARILIERHQLSEAEELLNQSREDALALDMKGPAYEAAIYLADVKARSGQPEEALELLDTSERQAEEEGSIFAPTADRVRALALAAIGRRAEAVDVAGAALDAAQARSLDYEVAMLLLCKADLLEGEDAEAAAALRAEGNAIVDRLEIRPLEAV
ncbi:MAG TPA: adenylate/guanylate cyclase domain-containing protein [Acidimicrobiia bacterium]|nr:adenylate/guanylate cyclase domain-containing protein [Acidimicrobiia bacterium]